LRREIEQQGVMADPFLADDPNCPVYGLNLACAYPFPAGASRAYNTMAGRLAALDPAVYVYPLWETHVTIATFVNFSLHRRPGEPDISHLKALAGRIIGCIGPLTVKSFGLQLHAPVLTRKAAIIPISNPTGEIARLRARVRQLIECDPALHAELLARGLSAPQIIHSTVMRFQREPPDPGRLIEDFQPIAATARLGGMEVNEILLTEETKPYMREGKVLHRFGME
jgi:hypothetical protein